MPSHRRPADAEFASVTHCAGLGDIDAKTIYRAVEAGELPAYRPKGRRVIRIRLSDFYEWLTPVTPATGRR